MTGINEAVVIHVVNGTTKTTRLVGDRMSITSNLAAGTMVELLGPDDRPQGYAWFARAEVVLRGTAARQYQPLTRPADPPRETR